MYVRRVNEFGAVAANRQSGGISASFVASNDERLNDDPRLSKKPAGHSTDGVSSLCGEIYRYKNIEGNPGGKSADNCDRTSVPERETPGFHRFFPSSLFSVILLDFFRLACGPFLPRFQPHFTSLAGPFLSHFQISFSSFADPFYHTFSSLLPRLQAFSTTLSALFYLACKPFLPHFQISFFPLAGLFHLTCSFFPSLPDSFYLTCRPLASLANFNFDGQESPIAPSYPTKEICIKSLFGGQYWVFSITQGSGGFERPLWAEIPAIMQFFMLYEAQKIKYLQKCMYFAPSLQKEAKWFKIPALLQVFSQNARRGLKINALLQLFRSLLVPPPTKTSFSCL